MQVTMKQMERVALFTVTGRVDHSTAPELRQALMNAVDGGQRNIVVDLGAVAYLSSAGLKVLHGTAKTVRSGLTGGDVRLAQMPDNIKETFDLAGFTALFKIYPDVIEAVGSF